MSSAFVTGIDYQFKTEIRGPWWKERKHRLLSLPSLNNCLYFYILFHVPQRKREKTKRTVSYSSCGWHTVGTMSTEFGSPDSFCIKIFKINISIYVHYKKATEKIYTIKSYNLFSIKKWVIFHSADETWFELLGSANNEVVDILTHLALCICISILIDFQK